MAGSFDFYVDESLLEQLLGGDSGKTKSKSTLVPTPAPVAPAQEPVVPTVEAVEPVEVTPRADAVSVAEVPAVEPQPEPVLAAEHESLAIWREADALYAGGDHTAAALSYERAASVTDPAESAQRSTLLYNAAICQILADQFASAKIHLQHAAEQSPESRAIRLALALVCFRLGEYADAAEHCARILNTDPADEEALLGKIQALYGANDLDSATAVCEEFQKQHPSNSTALEAALAVAVKRNNRPEVEHAARQLLRAQSGSLTAVKVLAAIAIADRDFETAANHCETLLANPEIDFDACIHAAETLQQVGRVNRALQAADQALRLNPQSAEALLKLAESQQKLSLWAEAQESYQKALALNPNAPDALWNLALVQEELGAFDQAAETLTMAVRIHPNSEEASLRLASLHAAAGRLQESSAVLEHCLMLRKDWPEALFLSGIVLHQLGQSGPAQDAVLKALEYKPDETAWIESLERIAVDRDDALVALDCHEKLAEANIETPEMAYNLGVVLQKENEPELAAKCYVRALEQKPDFELALLNLGYALHDLGREEEAKACWGKAVRLDPSLALGYFQ